MPIECIGGPRDGETVSPLDHPLPPTGYRFHALSLSMSGSRYVHDVLVSEHVRDAFLYPSPPDVGTEAP